MAKTLAKSGVYVGVKRLNYSQNDRIIPDFVKNAITNSAK